MERILPVLGMSVSYFDTEPDISAKPVLLFFHGWGANKETFLPVIEALRARYRLIAPDLPGFGKTGEPDRPWNADDYAAFIEAFVSALGLRGAAFCVCGHSHGGRVAIKWAATRPDSGLTRLILIDSAGLKAKRSPVWYTKVCAYKIGKALAGLPLLKSFLGPFADRYAEKVGSRDYRQASPLMRKTMSLLLDEDMGKYLTRIKAPTLIFWGAQDDETPLSDGKRMERDIPDAGLVVLDPAGHYSYLDQLPTFLRALIYFMEH